MRVLCVAATRGMNQATHSAAGMVSASGSLYECPVLLLFVYFTD